MISRNALLALALIFRELVGRVYNVTYKKFSKIQIFKK